jgi:hypothetical protein
MQDATNESDRWINAAPLDSRGVAFGKGIWDG